MELQRQETPSTESRRYGPVGQPTKIWLECTGGEMRFGPFMVIGLLLLVLWAGGFLMFHVASGLIHLLLLFAVISFVAHLVTGSRTA